MQSSMAQRFSKRVNLSLSFAVLPLVCVSSRQCRAALAHKVAANLSRLNSDFTGAGAALIRRFATNSKAVDEVRPVYVP